MHTLFSGKINEFIKEFMSRRVKLRMEKKEQELQQKYEIKEQQLRQEYEDKMRYLNYNITVQVSVNTNSTKWGSYTNSY